MSEKNKGVQTLSPKIEISSNIPSVLGKVKGQVPKMENPPPPPPPPKKMA
jgi:hypothetical protein